MIYVKETQVNVKYVYAGLTRNRHSETLQ